MMDRRRITLMMGTATLALVMVGCNKPLFPENSPRSQYERYAELRGLKKESKIENPTGPDVPNLRERLRPMDDQP